MARRLSAGLAALGAVLVARADELLPFGSALVLLAGAAFSVYWWKRADEHFAHRRVFVPQVARRQVAIQRADPSRSCPTAAGRAGAAASAAKLGA